MSGPWKGNTGRLDVFTSRLSHFNWKCSLKRPLVALLALIAMRQLKWIRYLDTRSTAAYFASTVTTISEIHVILGWDNCKKALRAEYLPDHVWSISLKEGHKSDVQSYASLLKEQFTHCVHLDPEKWSYSSNVGPRWFPNLSCLGAQYVHIWMISIIRQIGKYLCMFPC